jgi:hypothetical protein
LKLNAQKKFSRLRFFELNHHSSNLGLVRHLTGEISNVLSKFQYIIVIEDDIRVSKSFIKNMINGLNIHKNNKTNGIVGGFSPLHFKFMKNSWRVSRYPFIWGWACSSTTWQGYRYDISSDNLELKLLDSSTWAKLNSSQKLKWLNLFKQVQSNPLGTWDIQLTYLSYCKNFVNILPVFSLIGNEGFNDLRAVHTKGKKPKFVTISNLNNSVISCNKLREMRILNFFDKLWMNDF